MLSAITKRPITTIGVLILTIIAVAEKGRTTMDKVLEVYKGTDKDMKCYGGYQYEIGRQETDRDLPFGCLYKAHILCNFP